MNKTFDVVCVGVAIVDSIIRGFDPEPVSAGGFRAESASLRVGGDAVNQAIAAARLGMRTRIVCALGRDDAGELIAGALRRGGVDTSLVQYKDAPTPVTTMFVRPDGSRKSITVDSRKLDFHPERDPGFLHGAGALLLGSLFRAPFDDPAAILTLLRAARAEGVPVYADTKLPNFRALSLDDLAEALPLIDCITPNEAEAAHYTGESEPEAMAEAFLRRGMGSVLLKLGERGCYYRDADRALWLDAFPVPAVDACGAGDNFIAGFVAERLRGAGVEDALRFANACGAICTTAVGASAALQSRQQVLAFLAAHPTEGIIQKL
jgi:sugar/nucleoside kinase (ribokinase family)